MSGDGGALVSEKEYVDVMKAEVEHNAELLQALRAKFETRGKVMPAAESLVAACRLICKPLLPMSRCIMGLGKDGRGRGFDSAVRAKRKAIEEDEDLTAQVKSQFYTCVEYLNEQNESVEKFKDRWQPT